MFKSMHKLRNILRVIGRNCQKAVDDISLILLYCFLFSSEKNLTVLLGRIYKNLSVFETELPQSTGDDHISCLYSVNPSCQEVSMRLRGSWGSFYTQANESCGIFLDLTPLGLKHILTFYVAFWSWECLDLIIMDTVLKIAKELSIHAWQCSRDEQITVISKHVLNEFLCLITFMLIISESCI